MSRNHLSDNRLTNAMAYEVKKKTGVKNRRLEITCSTIG